MITSNKKYSLNNEDWAGIFRQLGAKEKIQAARRIALKPNFVYRTKVTDASHAITDLHLLGSLVKFLCYINNDAVIYICESDSTCHAFAYLKFEKLNLPYSLKLNERELQRIRLLDLSRDRLVLIENENFLFYNRQKQLWLSQTFVETDFKISLSNLKTHTITGYSGACKNLFGCLPDMDKSVNHPFLHSVIHDLVLAIQPDLSIVDGFVGMERNGPVNGDPVDLGLRLFSDSPLEADVNGVCAIGMEAHKISYLRVLEKTSQSKSIVPSIRLQRIFKKVDTNIRIKNVFAIACQRLGCRLAFFGNRLYAFDSLYDMFKTMFIYLKRRLIIRG